MNTALLRQRLGEIAGSSPDETRTHWERIEALRGEFNHSIQLKQPQDASQRADCISYALGVPEALLFLTGTFPQILDDLMKSDTVPTALTEIPKDKAGDGIIILYFNAGQLKHAGYLNKGRVISKWGKNPFYEHAVDEVPASYGNTIRFYAKPGRWDVTKALVAFIRQHPRYVDLRGPFEDLVANYEDQFK